MKVLPIVKPDRYFDNPTKLAVRKSEVQKYASEEGAKYVPIGTCYVYNRRAKVREIGVESTILFTG